MSENDWTLAMELPDNVQVSPSANLMQRDSSFLQLEM